MNAYMIGLLLNLNAFTPSTDGATESLRVKRGSHIEMIADFSKFQAQKTEKGTWTFTSPEMESPLEWHETVLSWNLKSPMPEDYLQVEIKAIYPDRATKFYHMGEWSLTGQPFPRRSVNKQADDDGDVLTDTLSLKRPAKGWQVRLTAGCEETLKRLSLLTLNFWNNDTERAPLPAAREAWGKLIDVPQRCQRSYKGGDVWCSPTTVSMVLAHYANELKRPELDKEVPEVVKGVYDPAWGNGGTGNWSFNVAYAGSFQGLVAYVDRLTDVSDLERWIAAGYPVICSVSYKLLKGVEDGSEGHLVICVGFTETGDVVVNDPWARLEKGESVRKTFPRQNLINAWRASNNTVYLILPDKKTGD